MKKRKHKERKRRKEGRTVREKEIGMKERKNKRKERRRNGRNKSDIGQEGRKERKIGRIYRKEESKEGKAVRKERKKEGRKGINTI